MKQIHEALKNDLAYIWSVEHHDVRNMQMVLRAYGHPFTPRAAQGQIMLASDLAG